MDSIDFVENILETSSRSNTPLGIRPIFDFNNDNEDIPSLPVICQMDDFGRESLGIINLDSLDVGRESLWIANIKPTDYIGGEFSELKRQTFTQSECSVLNKAFIKSDKDSARSSVSSRDSNSPSFNLFNISSKIHSYFKPDLGHDDFMDTFDFDAQIHLNRKSSLSPNSSEKFNDLSYLQEIDNLSSMLKDIVSVQNKYKDRNFLKSTEKLKNNSFITESNEAFSDSVFIEANHLATRFEDGSIYDLDVCENDMLDSIQEPEDFVNLSNDNSGPLVHEKETVFKMVDKILPPSNQNLPLVVSFRGNKSNICPDNEIKISKGKSPKDILSTLSEILNNDSLISEKQKFEGQNMISNLAAILTSNANSKQNHLDDSGHSSIENEAIMASPENVCYEVLDLRKKKSETCDNTQSTEICVPLDLSLKSKSFDFEKNSVPKILPPKFIHNPPQPLLKPNNVNNDYLVSTTENKIFANGNKFKLKKTEDNLTMKKGPMRAMVPLDNMAKRKSGSKLQMTPKRNELQSDLKKTDTPVNGLRLKPVAQSTPEGIGSSSSLNKSNSSESSGKIVKHKLSYLRTYGSNKSPDLKNKKLPFTRRHSVVDIRKSKGDEKVLVRSSSVGRYSEVKSGVNNAQKLLPVTKTNSRIQQKNLPVLKENRSKSVTRSSFSRKNGKENIC